MALKVVSGRPARERRGGIRVGVARMDHDRQPRPGSELELTIEEDALV